MSLIVSGELLFFSYKFKIFIKSPVLLTISQSKAAYMCVGKMKSSALALLKLDIMECPLSALYPKNRMV